MLLLLVPFGADALAGLPSNRGSAVVAIGLYVATLMTASQVGEFPVPVVGYGPSTVLSYYSAAAAALWVGLRRTHTPTGSPRLRSVEEAAWS